MAKGSMMRWVFAALLSTAAALAHADEALWALLQKGGQVVLVRHGLTEPGVGDPPGFQLGECRTQRNLNEEGRSEARRLGAALRERGVQAAGVLTSPWCRCVETAQLVFGRSAEVRPALSNLFGRHEREAAQVAELRQLVQAPRAGNLFLVTHGSTTLALTGVSPATAEMVVLSPQAGGGFRVAGRLKVS